MKKLRRGLLYAFYILCGLFFLTLLMLGIIYSSKYPPPISPHHVTIPPYYGQPHE